MTNPVGCNCKWESGCRGMRAKCRQQVAALQKIVIVRLRLTKAEPDVTPTSNCTQSWGSMRPAYGAFVIGHFELGVGLEETWSGQVELESFVLIAA